MGQLIVRNLDDRIVSRLKRQAERENLSLEQKVRSILGRAAKREPEEFDRVTSDIRAQTSGAGLDINALIREDRDR